MNNIKINMKKIVLGVVAVIVIVGAVMLVKGNDDQSTLTNGELIKIGAILPMTGDFAFAGEAINQGALLAIDEAKVQGINIQYIAEDDRSTAVGSTNAANKLVRNDKVHGAITATVQEVKPVAPIFASAGVPLLATWDSNDYIKTAGNNIFTIGFSTEGAGQKMALYTRNNLKLSKVAVVAQEDEWSSLIASAFEKKFKDLGGTVVVSERVQPTQKDFRTVLAKIKTAGAEGIYFPFLPNTIAPFAKQVRELGINGILMTGDSISPDEVAQAGSSAENMYFTNLYAENTKDLESKYQAKFGEGGDMTFVSFGYDGVRTLIEAVRISRGDGVSLSDAMRKVNIPGLDRKINFSGKQYAEKLEYLYKVENGEFVEVQK